MKNLEIHKKLLKSTKKTFTFSDLKKLLTLKNDNSIYQAIKRLKKDGVINSFKNGVYYLTGAPPNEFLAANQIYYPSYISLETALNYYGILIQTPQIIFSVTCKRGKELLCNNKEYSYHHLTQKYFFDYIKEKDFLIATPEKALIDTIFLNSFGKLKTDLDELVLNIISKKRLYRIKERIDSRAFNKRFSELKL